MCYIFICDNILLYVIIRNADISLKFRSFPKNRGRQLKIHTAKSKNYLQSKPELSFT